MLLFSHMMQSGMHLRPQIPALRPRCQAKTFPFKNTWKPLCIIGCALFHAFTASVQQGPNPQGKLLDPKVIIALLHWKLSLRQVNHRNPLPSTLHSNTSSLQMPKAPLLCIAWLPPETPYEQLFSKVHQDQASELYKCSKGWCMQPCRNSSTETKLVYPTRQGLLPNSPFPSATANAGCRHM